MAENQSTIDQIRKFYGNLGNFQRVLLFGIPSLVIIGLVLIFASSGSKEYDVLFNDLSSQDASKIVEVLKEKQIEYKLEDNGSTVLVEQGEVFQTRIDLAGEGLPESSVVGYELFDNTNLGMSEFVQQVNYRRALEGELSRTIASMDEVKKVRVHLVIPETALFEKDQKQPTASVTIHLQKGQSISPASIKGIQKLVAGSVEGMMSENVTVVNHKGKILSEPVIDVNSVAGMTQMQHEQQKHVEQYLARKVKSMLDGVLGVDNSSVQVNAELDFTRIEQTVTDYDPEKQVVRSEQNIVEKSESTDSLSYPAVSMSKDESNSIQNYEISRSVESIVHEVGNIKRLSVAAVINGKTEIIQNDEGLKEVQYIPRTEEEMQKLEEIIRNAVGFDLERNDQISVINVPFDTMMEEIDPNDLVELEWWQQPDIQKILFLLAAIMVAVILMFSLLQSKYIKDRLRIALELPKKLELDKSALDDDVVEEDEDEEEVEELDLDEDDLLLLPAELPEQLLLEGEKDDEAALDEEMDQDGYDDDSLASRARADLDDADEPELSEESMMKLELKNKVEEFMDDQTEEAVRLVRVFLQQDLQNAKF